MFKLLYYYYKCTERGGGGPVHMKPRQPPVTLGARSRGSYGKIEDCEQSTGLYI